MDIYSDPKLKNFWYPIAPMNELSKNPISFTLLNEKIVLWLDENNHPCSVIDRCCHRQAQLSKGWVKDGNIVCPYHSWEFNGAGDCVCVPQSKMNTIPKSFKVQSFHCKEKYGHAWVCLGEPVREIPEIPEALDINFRYFSCFLETWNTSSLRVIENELDMAHFATVHRGTFGNQEEPLPLSYELKQVDEFTLHLKSELSVKAPPQQMKNTRAPEAKTTRIMNVTWYLPFMIRLQISYPSGLEHIIINHPTPIDDKNIRVVQFCFRNDKENDVSINEIIIFERLILNEDRFILETSTPYVNLNPQFESHIPTDKSGLLMRKMFSNFLNKEKNDEQSSEASLNYNESNALNLSETSIAID